MSRDTLPIWYEPKVSATDLDRAIRAFEQGDGATIRTLTGEVLDALRELKERREVRG